MFVQNQVLNGTYRIISPIGSGGTSAVYLAYHLRLQKHVVVKQMRGTFSGDFLMRKEVDILKNLHHPNLPQVYDFIQEHDAVYTVIDYVNGYDLGAYIGAGTQFTEEQLKYYLHQIGQVLSYLHSHQPAIIHSDIKPENIIIDQEGNAILIDFNMSLDAGGSDLLGLTLPYASPEQIELARIVSRQQTPTFELDGRSDLYSLGATFYELICRIRPTPGVPPAPLHTMALLQYSREFLMLIDRLMVYDREKRLKTAARLVTALERMDGRYRTYFAVRCVSLLLSAIMLSSGIYCYIRGARQKPQELYQSQISAVNQSVADGLLDKAEQLCDNILASDELQAYMRSESQAQAQLYHALGDIYYYREEFATSATYYRYAVETFDADGGTTLSVYMRDAAIAYAQSGDVQTAQYFLDIARNSKASTDDLLLVEVVLNARTGDSQQCISNARSLLAQCDRAEICLRAAMCAATVAPDADSRISWLELAGQYGGGRVTKRNLAVAYVEKANSNAQPELRTEMINKALSIYQELNESNLASLEDRLNYSVVLSMSEDQTGAIAVLKKALEQYPNNYRVLMNLCFIYNQLGDPTNTSVYCAEALRAWKTSTSSERLSETSDEIQDLLEIGRRFGVGG